MRAKARKAEADGGDFAREEEGKSPGKEEEGKGSRALHVASPKTGKISTLIPEVFMTSNFYLQKFSITK